MERLDLSKTYKFGPEDISYVEFGELTAREMGELPVGDMSGMRLKDFYPIACMLIGRPQSFLYMLCKQDITKVVEKTVFLLAN